MAASARSKLRFSIGGWLVFVAAANLLYSLAGWMVPLRAAGGLLAPGFVSLTTIACLLLAAFALPVLALVWLALDRDPDKQLARVESRRAIG